MKFSQILSRLSGFSCPLFGVSWTPDKTEAEKAEVIVHYMEDRRALYYPLSIESPFDCESSINGIRAYLTKSMENISSDTKLFGYIKAMRSACRKFITQCDTLDLMGISSDRYRINNPSKKVSQEQLKAQKILFYNALGELRNSFGIILAQMAVAYGIDIDDELASILPPEDE